MNTGGKRVKAAACVVGVVKDSVVKRTEKSGPKVVFCEGKRGKERGRGGVVDGYVVGG